MMHTSVDRKAQVESLMILDSPRDTSITPDDEVMYVGQELTCNTRAVPAADRYEWIMDGSEPAGLTQIITIPDEWANQNITLACVAINDVDSDSVAISFTVVRKYILFR